MGALGQVIVRAGERLAIWVVAVGIAFVPAISGARTRPSPFFMDLFWRINLAGFFREVFFVAIIIAIIGITNLIDNILRRQNIIHPFFRMAAWLAFSYYILLIVYGTYVFTVIPLHSAIEIQDFYVDCGVLIGAMIAGAVTEILIAIGE
jgi:hypothetical protein